jgi:hypothetical protein
MSVETEIVQVSITQDSVALPRAGFGVALILSHAWPFSDDLRKYGSEDDVAVDWAVTTPEFRSTLSLFGQDEKPTEVWIGRAAAVTLQYTLNAQAIRNSDSRSYKINVVGQGFTDAVVAYTSDSSTSAAEIHNGLVAALNAVASRNYTAAFAPLVYADHTFTAANATEQFTIAAHGLQTGDGPFQVSNSGGALPTGLSAATDYWVIVVDVNTIKLATSLANALAGTNLLISTDGTGTQTIADTVSTVRPASPFTVTGNAGGNWFSLEIVDVTAISVKMTHTGDPTADLDALQLEDSGWYCLLTHFNSPSVVQNAATWVEAHTKIYAFDLPETDAIQVVVGSGTDALAACHSAGFTRSAGSYHHRPATFMSSAWAGRVLPVDPGGDTWALKPLIGVGIASKLTTTNRNNLKARNANYCTVGFGKNITFNGTTFDGDFIDVTRGLDWLNDDITKGIGGVLLAVNKIPFTNQGVTSIVNQVEASLGRAVQRGILRDTPKPVVTAPDVEDVSDADRGQRLLPDVLFTGQLAGAIHKVIVKGRVSL